MITDIKIPHSRGTGSSASAMWRVWLGERSAAGRLRLSREQMLPVASDMEGHPDNVAPAIYGNLRCPG